MATSLAFALAGLGGFNAHGAGFLQAAHELGVVPDLVTATSGQIIVVAEWLQETPDLRKLLFNPAHDAFRPAVVEYWRRWARWPTSLDELTAATFPAQELASLRRPEEFSRIAATLNAASIGVVFNTYDPATGKGQLHGNDAARAILVEETLAATDEGAVASALWLSLYGFDGLPKGSMDGAYHRSCIVAELSDFERIFAVRPLAEGWRGRLPATWFDLQDWQTEMWFSASYKAEVAEMLRINKLLDKNCLTGGTYKKVDLIPVTTEHTAGFFNYFKEREDIFQAAYEAGRAKLTEHLKG